MSLSSFGLEEPAQRNTRYKCNDDKKAISSFFHAQLHKSYLAATAFAGRTPAAVSS
jgi:hypothetical protein